MSNAQLSAQMRASLGTGASRRLREEGLIPAVVYGGKGEPLGVQLSHREFSRLLEHTEQALGIIDLDVEGSIEPVIIRDVQRHPFKPLIEHVDLQRVVAGEPMVMQVPLRFINRDTAPGVKAGGQMRRLVFRVKVMGLPDQLPREIVVDCGGLERGQKLFLSNLPVPEGAWFPHLKRRPPSDFAIVAVT